MEPRANHLRKFSQFLIAGILPQPQGIGRSDAFSMLNLQTNFIGYSCVIAHTSSLSPGYPRTASPHSTSITPPSLS